MGLAARPGRAAWSSVARRPEPAREPAARADVRLARFADRRADEDALGLARPAAGQDQRRRDALDEILAEPGRLPPAPARFHLAGADDHEIVRGLALLGRDLLGRVAAAHAHGGLRQARLRRPGGQRVAQRVLAARVGGDAENGRRRRRAPRRAAARARAPARALPPRRRRAGAAWVAAGCARPRGRPRDSRGGGSECAGHGDVEQDVLLAEGQRGRRPGERPRAAAGARASGARRPRTSRPRSRPRPSVGRPGAGSTALRRDLLGPDQDAHAVALVVRHVGRDRQRQRAERDAVIAAAADEDGAGAEERRDEERARPLVETRRARRPRAGARGP